MTAKFPKGRSAPAKAVASAEIALPPASAGAAPAGKLSGAFAAALGTKPRLSHAGENTKESIGKKRPANMMTAPKTKEHWPAATLAPRKGHR